MTSYAEPPPLWDGGPADAEAAGTPTPEHDPEAPYGRRIDGTPKTSARGRPAAGGPREPNGRPSRAGRRTRTRTPGPPRASRAKPGAGPKPAAKARGKVDYTPGLNSLLQVATAPLIMRRQWHDVAALLVHGPPLTEAISDLANDDPRIAAIVGRAAELGPYGAVLMGVSALVSQLAVNHRLIPAEVGGLAGALPPEQLINLVDFGAAYAAAQQAAAPAADEAA